MVACDLTSGEWRRAHTIVVLGIFGWVLALLLR